MAPIKPVLVVFGVSHFCEKARWALDWHGISYTEIGWPPGLHRALLRQHGAKGSSLPVVLDGDLVVEGSGAIIDWAESKAQDRTRSLNPQTGDLAETREIERRADEVVGFHVRRLAYAETLPYYSHLVRPTLFLRCTAWLRRSWLPRFRWYVSPPTQRPSPPLQPAFHVFVEMHAQGPGAECHGYSAGTEVYCSEQQAGHAEETRMIPSSSLVLQCCAVRKERPRSRARTSPKTETMFED